VSFEELAPHRSLAPLWSGVDPIPLQNVGDRRPANPVADILECSSDAGVSPARILSRHSDGEFRNDSHYSTSARGSPLVGPLPSNELPVPTKDGVGSDKRRNLGESPSPDGLAADREPPTLIVGQSESSAPELLLQDAVLFSEILDDCVLMAADPTGEGGHEDLPGLEGGGHPSIVARKRSIRKLSLAVQTGLFFPGILSAD